MNKNARTAGSQHGEVIAKNVARGAGLVADAAVSVKDYSLGFFGALLGKPFEPGQKQAAPRRIERVTKRR